MHTLKHTLIYLFFLWGSFVLLPVVNAQDTIVSAQKIKVSGRILDASNQNALPGIKVEIPGYSSAMTNDSGYFSLKVPNLKATIFISGTDYHACEVPLRGQLNIIVHLYEASHTSLYENANSLTGKVSLSRTTNAISSTNTSNNNWKQAPDDISKDLQGKIAGLNVISRSGAVGIGSEMFLRGFSSLNTSNRPLIIVDGNIFDMNSYGNSIIDNYYYDPLTTLDPRDIDNITVSKDANSIYGSKGANGVIYITTTHTTETATKIDVNVSSGLNFSPKQYPLLDASEYRIYLSQLLTTNGYSASKIASLPYIDDNISNADYYTYHNNTNWQDKVLKDYTSQQDYYLKVAGGDENALYGLSLGYLVQNGIISNTSNKRFSLQFNGDIDVTNKLKLTTKLSLTKSIRELKDQGLNEKVNPLFMSLIKAPIINCNEISESGTISPTVSDVDIFNIGNPKAIVQNMNPESNSFRFFGNISLIYQVNKNLNINSLVGITFDKNKEKSFKPHLGVVPDTLDNLLAIRTSKVYQQHIYSIYNDSWLQYHKTFGYLHDVSLKGGFRYNFNQAEADLQQAYNSGTDDLKNLGDGATIVRSGSTDKWNWLNIYASADYGFNSKYFLSASVGMDGSSRFGENVSNGLTFNGNKYGIFPSLSAGWLISSENFMTKLPVISLLKFRASYGLTGNDDIGNYSTHKLYTSDNLYQLPGIVESGISNSELQWETNKKFDAGIDLALWNDRVSMTFDIYKTKTDNMLVNETPASYFGTDNIITNNGAMETKGLELAFNGRVLNGPVKWDLGFSIAFNRSKITKLPGDSLTTSYAGGTILSAVGSSAAEFYGYRTNGIYASDAIASAEGLHNKLSNGETASFEGGDVRFVDTDNNGIIDDRDRVSIGKFSPDFTGSFSTNVAWKRFSLNALFTYSYGNDIYNYTRSRLESMSGFENQTPAVINRWRTDGQITNMPRAAWGDPQMNNRFSDRWIEDGSYIRLKTLTISYDLPIKNNNFKYATLYASAYNLWTYTNYKGYDPEFSSNSSVLRQGVDIGMVPQYKTVMVGFKLGL